jgi:hypothetical protein
MAIEINTLFHLSITIAALLGILLLYTWWLARMPALGWWGAAFVVIAAGLALLAGRGALHHIASIPIANALLFIGAAMFWTGARVFEGKKPMLVGIAAVPVVWLVLCAVPDFYASINARTLFVSTALGVLTLATAYELWLARAIPLPTRLPAIAILVFHGALFFVRDVLVLLAPLEEGLPGATSLWYAVFHYEIILYLIAIAYCYLAMAKERGTQSAIA